jgi:molybdopterin synthase catalytic subunit
VPTRIQKHYRQNGGYASLIRCTTGVVFSDGQRGCRAFKGLVGSQTPHGISVGLSRSKFCSASSRADTSAFPGTTRDSFADLPVKSLTYQSYVPLALRSLLSIARSVKEKHGLTAISLTHRLGTVPIGEESILVAVSAPHRQAGWRGGEEALELCKEKVEIWKLEEFEGDEDAVWRANRDGQMGVRVPKDELDMGKAEEVKDTAVSAPENSSTTT